MTRIVGMLFGAVLIGLGCGGSRSTPIAAAPLGVPAIEVVSVRDVAPPGGDGAPRLTLAFRFADGTRVAIAGEATAYAPFGARAALVDLERRLVLVSADGARSVLARESGAPPAAGPRGELAYIARYDLEVEVHVLDARGRDRVVAGGLADAGVLAPQADGQLFFIGARKGGVAGLWSAGHAAARCLTNCELQTGVAWGDRFVPLPADAASIRAHAGRVEWLAADGTQRSTALVPVAALPAQPAGDALRGGAP